MAYYYVNKNAQNNGDHEVHVAGCKYLPSEENRINLGNFSNCKPAVTEAKKHYKQSNGCFFCARDCHTS